MKLATSRHVVKFRHGLVSSSSESKSLAQTSVKSQPRVAKKGFLLNIRCEGHSFVTSAGCPWTRIHPSFGQRDVATAVAASVGFH